MVVDQNRNIINLINAIICITVAVVVVIIAVVVLVVVNVQDGPKNRDYQPTFDFETSEPISTIFGKLQSRFVLNTSLNSVFINFVATEISLSTTATGISAENIKWNQSDQLTE